MYSILVFLAVILVLAGIRSFMRIRAIRKVNEKTVEEKTKQFNELITPFGFEYSGQEDVVQSSMYPWQREFGYCRLYDESAAKVNMILDCEPIYFAYGGKRWMIELWKGQYGCTTGAEIGIYATDQKDIEIPGIFKGPFFKCVSDEERIGMKFILNREGRELFGREDTHWWLTGFSMGTYSRPEQLTMEAVLTFTEQGMRDAFLNALIEVGYPKQAIEVHGLTVSFLFDRPRSKQPKRNKMMTALRQKQNKTMIELYNWITRDFVTTVDKVIFLKYYCPIFYRILGRKLKNIKIQKLLKKPYKKIQRFIK